MMFSGLNKWSRHFAPDLQLLFRSLAEGRIQVQIKASLSLAEIKERIASMRRVQEVTPSSSTYASGRVAT